MQQNNQLTLFTPGGVIEESINRVFGSTAVKNSKQITVGNTIKLRPVKEIREQFKAELEGLDKDAKKDKLQALMLADRDQAMKMLKAEVTSLDPSWTFTKRTTRTLGTGVKQITYVIQDINRAPKGLDVQKVAEALGKSVEWVKEMMELAAMEKEEATEVAGKVTQQAA